MRLFGCLVFFNFGLIGFFVSPIVVAQGSIDAETLQRMKELKEKYQLPSVSVAVGLVEEIVFAEAIGFSDIEKNRPATRETQYSVGSLAKPMTGIALARLMDSGQVDLQAPVSKYVKQPEYTQQFSVRELAAHIAGVPHNTAERHTAEFVDIKDHISPFDAFYVFDSHPLLFPPGTDYEYSSNGYILLSAVIESAADMNYVNFLQSSLWDELGMKSTELDTFLAGREHEASYYQAIKPDGNFAISPVNRDRSFLFGGGGFISTPSDLIRLSRATFPEDFLSDDARLAMATPARLRNGEINSDRYSLGWRVAAIRLTEDAKEEWLALHHGGVTDKASTAYLLVVPECKASIAFATNYIPEKFWRMRGDMAKVLKGYINQEQCRRSFKAS
ncbi:serine hydrolase domain-containing protein [Microbulbifer sp. TYP-18]|uniref:serine hydrolase domain-containing protein n=1 Tax=Microbulbifer sp. TYP-18 TaxID=3230024 RepID=UPI0034C5BB03